MIYTLQYGTYTFANQTFEIEGHSITSDTPVIPIRRFNGGVVHQGFLQPKAFRIKGKMYGTDIDTVHQAINIMERALHNKGDQAALKYRSDRQVQCRLGPGGIEALYEKGLYEYLANVMVQMIADEPCAEDVNTTTSSGSRTNNSAVTAMTNAGTYPTRPVWTFVAASTFLNDLFVQNNANSLWFRFQGTLVNGQTLVIDCDAGCVLLHVGAQMIDAICYLAGDLFWMLEAGSNNVVIDAASLSFSAVFRSRWYI